MGVYITAFITAFAVTAAAGLLIIPALRRLKAGQHIRTDGPQSHLVKAGTPTMGGIMFIIGITAAVITAHFTGAKSDGKNAYTHFFILLFAIIFGIIGFLDDYSKLKKKRNLGLTAAQKIMLQVSVAAAFIMLMRLNGNLTPNLYIPFFNTSILLPVPVYLVFAAFVIVAEVNAVNLTDGADGLASGVTLPVALCFAAAAYKWGAAFTGAGAFAAAVCGGLAGFLIYNFYPAKVIMGDTGSHFLGAAVAALAFALDMPLILITLGIIYIAESLSDVIQVTYFKATHGKRVFKMAPIHHHFELSGWSEYKLFFVFSSISAIFAVISYFAVRNRFF